LHVYQYLNYMQDRAAYSAMSLILAVVIIYPLELLIMTDNSILGY